MISLLIKSRCRRLMKTVKKNAHLLIIFGIGMWILGTMAPYFQNMLSLDLGEVIPFLILCFSIMNLLGNIPRLKMDVAAVCMKIIGVRVFRIYTLIRLSLPSVVLGIVCVVLWPFNQGALYRTIACLFLNILVNIHCIIRIQYKSKVSIANYLLLAFMLVLFYIGNVWPAALAVVLYALFLFFYVGFDYTGLTGFMKMFEKMFYGYVNSESNTLGQTQDIMFRKNKNVNLKLMEKTYGNRWKFLLTYEITRIVNRWTQILNQMCAAVLITFFVRQVTVHRYVSYIALFGVLLIGQMMITYYIQSEKNNVRDGFYLLYTMKEKLICKYGIYMLLTFFPMACFWAGFEVNLYSILIYMYSPFQCILTDAVRGKGKRLLISIPFYVLTYFAFID